MGDRGPLHDIWAKAVKERDNWTCMICGEDDYIEAHHLYSWSKFEPLRFIISLGISLCPIHHTFFHKIYGGGEATKDQFQQFVRTYLLFRKLASRKDNLSSFEEKLEK
jgi:predicted restriction endonuclease